MIPDVVIIVLLVGIWLSIKELPIILGSFFSAGIVRATYLPVIIILAMIPAIFFSSDIVNNISKSSDLYYSPSILVICFGAAISVWIISFFTKWTSIIYALIASIFAWLFYTGNLSSISFFYKSGIAWLIAPVLSFIFSVSLLQIIRLVLKNTKYHLIFLNGFLRLIFFLSIVLSLFSFALNNGSMLLALTVNIDPYFVFNIGNMTIKGEFIVWMVFLLFILVLYYYPAKGIAQKLSYKIYDVNIEVAAAIMISMSMVMLIFSNNYICSIFGLVATPVSPTHVVLGAIFGICCRNSGMTVDKKELWKSGLSIFILPLLSFLVTYTLFVIIKIQKNLSSIDDFNNAQLSFDLTTFTIVSILILLVLTIIYIYRSKTKVSLGAKLEIAEGKNQLNEIQNVLVELEMKSIQIENDNLHKRLEIKRKDLINNALWISQQREFLDDLFNEIQDLKKAVTLQDKNLKILCMEEKIKDKKAFSHEMNELYSQVETLHRDFSVILHEKFKNLTEQERRLATLLRLGFSTKELASLMNITAKSVEVCRYRLRKRLKLKRDENLIQFIKSL